MFRLSYKNIIKSVSEIIYISEGKCQRIYNYCASTLIETREHEHLRFLGIEDIARKKGHNYNTVIYNQETGNTAAIFTGRKKKDIIDYLEGWLKDIKSKVEAIHVDMSRSYCGSVFRCLPNAKLVIDRFHIVA